MSNVDPQFERKRMHLAQVTRRHFFQQCGVGIGAMALGTLLRQTFDAGLDQLTSGAMAGESLRSRGRARDYEDLAPSPFTDPPAAAGGDALAVRLFLRLAVWFFAAAGAALMIRDGDLDGERLSATIRELADRATASTAPEGAELQRRWVMEAVYGRSGDGEGAVRGLKGGGAPEAARARLP